MEQSELQDKILLCLDCGKDFTFSAKEQAFFNERGFQTPKRCKPCRGARRERRNADAQNADGQNSRGEQPKRRGPDTRQRTEIICAECGIKATVPFVPREGQPVYCRDCHQDPRSR